MRLLNILLLTLIFLLGNNYAFEKENDYLYCQENTYLCYYNEDYTFDVLLKSHNEDQFLHLIDNSYYLCDYEELNLMKLELSKKTVIKNKEEYIYKYSFYLPDIKNDYSFNIAYLKIENSYSKTIAKIGEFHVIYNDFKYVDLNVIDVIYDKGVISRQKIIYLDKALTTVFIPSVENKLVNNKLILQNNEKSYANIGVIYMMGSNKYITNLKFDLNDNINDIFKTNIVSRSIYD